MPSCIASLCKVRSQTYLSHFESFTLLQVSWWDHCATAALDHRQHSHRTLFELQFHPLVSVQVKYNQILWNHTVFCLSSINKHRTFIDHCSMIFAGPNTDTFGFQDLNGLLLQIVLKHLVRALAHLSFTVEMKATSEYIQFHIVKNTCVTVTPLDDFLRSESQFLPEDLISLNLSFHYFLYRLRAHSSDHVSIETACC